MFTSIKRGAALMVLLCLVCAIGITQGEETIPEIDKLSERGSTFLSPGALKELRPDYEQFLESMALTLMENNLLAEESKEDWISFQLADFAKNGGYGTIAIMYNPNLLASIDSDSLALRLTAPFGENVMYIDTLRSFAPGPSNLPGLPLEVSLVSATGEPILCMYRWTATYGALKVWDRVTDSVRSVSEGYVSMDPILYWYADGVESASENLTVEFISMDDGASYGSYQIDLACDGITWRVKNAAEDTDN
ncbi:hypothetical protein FACS1894184_11150 [Clostridia bacterium]|nr:hypothetical protein FACS1894184_11150 [Clostridia bacterium]